MTVHFPEALLLNADYQPLSQFPLSLLPWDETISGVLAGKLDVLAEYDHVVHSPSTEMFLPSVVALKRFQPISQRVAFTRFNVFLRDGFRCQYCGGRHGTKQLTYDHVTPRSKGGVTSWTNIVSACHPCNARKADKMCAEVKMWPKKPPAQPSYGQLQAEGRKHLPTYLHRTWMDYLYWDSVLEP